jgi:hypothetical protein
MEEHFINLEEEMECLEKVRNCRSREISGTTS